jgi:excisionase family DNA binding protein
MSKTTTTSARTAPAQDDPFFNVAEAAVYLNQTEKWVRRNLEEGTLPRTKMRRLVRFRKSHLDKWVEENTGTSQGS